MAKAAVAFALFAVTSCGPADPAESDSGAHPEFAARDSAGIIIVENDGAVARAPSGWSVELEPGLQIGLVDGPEEYQLFRIRGVAQLPDGRIVVVNGGSRELRFYGEDGGFLHRTGGRGKGPGEYEWPALVPSLSHDSLMVYDQSLRRLTVLSPSGEVRASHSLGPSLGRSVHRFLGSTRTQLLGFNTISFITRRDGMQPVEPAEYLWVRPGDWVVDTVGVFPGRQAYTDELDGQSTMVYAPFSIMPSASVGSDGFYLTLGKGEPEILKYGISAHADSAQVRRIIRLREPPRLATVGVLDAFIEIKVASLPRLTATYMSRLYREASRPEHLPAFDSLLVDDLGWLWARTYDFDPEAPRSWLIFDPEGRAHGSVEVPPGLDIRQIGEDFVLGTWRDEFGVEYVRRHELVRAP